MNRSGRGTSSHPSRRAASPSAHGSAAALDGEKTALLQAIQSLASRPALVTQNAITMQEDSPYAEIMNAVVSALAQRDKQLQRLREELKQKNVFFASMAHELRTPLHAILSFARLTLRQFHTEDKDKLLDNCRRINNNGEQLLTLLNDILDFSSLEANGMRFSFDRIDMATLAEESMRNLQSILFDKQLSIEVTPPTCNTLVEADAGRIHQLLANMLGNAIKFSQPGQTIRIAFRATTLARSEEDSTDAVELSITDEGSGINPEQLDHIFRHYAQAGSNGEQQKGTGLGLAICKHIVERHGGVIWAMNNQQGGATFTCSLPRTQLELSNVLSSDKEPS